MRAAILVVDMVKDTLGHDWPITPQARAIVPRINELTGWARGRGYPVVFACDSFLENDFIFEGKMKPHSLRGSAGSEVAEALDVRPGDVYLPKRRFSAFFKTDLDQTLRTWKVDTVMVCGVSTHFCVLMTALDAVCNDFRAILVEDASAAFSPQLHAHCLDAYRKNPLHPLLQVLSVAQVSQLES